MRILGIPDRLRKVEKTRFPTWMAVDRVSPNDGDIVVAIGNSGNAVCGTYRSHYVYTAKKTRKAITMYDKWSLVERYDGTRLWRSFIIPPNENDKIVAVSSDFNEYVIADYCYGHLHCHDGQHSFNAIRPVSMYKFWENYPDAAENKRV